jgi:hypothetical protein
MYLRWMLFDNLDSILKLPLRTEKSLAPALGKAAGGDSPLPRCECECAALQFFFHCTPSRRFKPLLDFILSRPQNRPSIIAQLHLFSTTLIRPDLTPYFDHHPLCFNFINLRTHPKV